MVEAFERRADQGRVPRSELHARGSSHASHSVSRTSERVRKSFECGWKSRELRNSRGTEVSTTCGSGWVTLSDERYERRDPPATAGGTDLIATGYAKIATLNIARSFNAPRPSL